ncbi:MAG: glycosyltransferase family 1 protein [Desulfobacteraceae bacterium]|nr:MAG: glycosyltransferase family 1 protein [Desulfobacteraceae bacterium]
MRVIQVYNKRLTWGGEDLSIENTIRILEIHGNEVSYWSQDVQKVKPAVNGKIGLFFSGIYSQKTAGHAYQLIKDFKPEIVHAHNLYPQFSPSVLNEFQRNGIPTVWHPHDQRPMCPTGLSLYKGRVCEKCTDSGEHWCVIRNCRNNILESISYAVRNFIHRRFKIYQHYADMTIVWSEFLRQRLLKEGFSPNRTMVVPHPIRLPNQTINPSGNKYIAYLGRISKEKGIRELIASAKIYPIPLKIAGDYSKYRQIIRSAPKNIEFVGWLSRSRIPDFIKGARFGVMPSVCFETFPTVALEFMGFGVPVIGSDIGGIPEVIIDGETGLLSKPNDPETLAEKIKFLWDRPKLCFEMGNKARLLLEERYSDELYYQTLMGAYEKAKKIRMDSFRKNF